MSGYARPDKRRIIDTLRRRPTNRAPNYEMARLAMLAFSIILTGANAMGGELSTKSQPDLTWINPTDPRLAINGLPFSNENKGQWWRLPARAESRIADYIWNTSKASSGARIRLRSDTANLAIRLTYMSPPAAAMTPNLCLLGVAGIDCYADGQYLSTIAPDPGAQTLRFEDFFFRNVERRPREITLYLPLFAEVRVEAIGIDRDAKLLPPATFARPRPVVFYGTSITHGGCASRPGLSYEAILCRRLNLDFVNFGFNGCGRGEPAIAELLAEVDADGYVLDFAQNNYDSASYEAAYRPFIKILRVPHPRVPILCVTPIYWTNELPGTRRPNIHEAMREVVRHAVRACRAEGDDNIFLIEGNDILGPQQGDGLGDGLHPNQLGFWWMARGLEPHLRTALNLTAPED